MVESAIGTNRVVEHAAEHEILAEADHVVLGLVLDLAETHALAGIGPGAPLLVDGSLDPLNLAGLFLVDIQQPPVQDRVRIEPAADDRAAKLSITPAALGSFWERSTQRRTMSS